MANTYLQAPSLSFVPNVLCACGRVWSRFPHLSKVAVHSERETRAAWTAGGAVRVREPSPRPPCVHSQLSRSREEGRLCSGVSSPPEEGERAAHQQEVLCCSCRLSLRAPLPSHEENDHLEKRVGVPKPLKSFLLLPSSGNQVAATAAGSRPPKGPPLSVKGLFGVDQRWPTGLVRSLRACPVSREAALLPSHRGQIRRGLWLSLLLSKVSPAPHVHRLPVSQNAAAPLNHRQVPLGRNLHTDQ